MSEIHIPSKEEIREGINKKFDKLEADHAQLVALVKALPIVEDAAELIELLESHSKDAPEAWQAVEALLAYRKGMT